MTSTPSNEQLQVTISEAINLALREALAADGKVILLGEDIAEPAGGVFKATKGLSAEFGVDRVRDTPISEAAIAGVAVGAAIAGYRPVAEIMFMDFLPLACDQIVNHAAKLRYMTGGHMTVPLTIRSAVGGHMQGGATHSQSLEAWFMHVPGLKIAIPSNPYDAKGLLTSCIFDDDPCLFLETVRLLRVRGPVSRDQYSIPLGHARKMREGRDVSVITYGLTVQESMSAAKVLEEEGISVEVLDLRTLSPLDTDAILSSVARTRRAVVVHAATEICGVAAEIATLINRELFGQLDSPVERVAGKNTPIPAAREQEQVYYPSVASIAEAISRSVRGERGAT